MNQPSPNQTQRPGANARKIFRAILEVLDRSLTTRSVLAITVLLLIASWAYPPGYHPSNRSHGWFFLFDMSSVMRVDFGRLILLNAIISAGGLLFARLIGRSERARSIAVRAAFYLLLAAPIVPIVWNVVARVGYMMYQAAQQRAQVGSQELKQITLLDLQLDPSPEGVTRGRVRNSLPRAVRQVVLRASFYNRKKELLEVREFVLNNELFLPGTTSSFYAYVRVEDLPRDYTSMIEVIEAHYIQ